MTKKKEDKVINLEARRKQDYLDGELEKLGLDLEMLEDHNKKKSQEDLVGFFKEREKVYRKVDLWISQNFPKTREAINTLADLLSGNVSEEELLDVMEQIYQEEEM